MKNCPFNRFRPCREDCELHIETTRTYTGQSKVEIVRGCALRIGSQEAENASNRLAMMHSEVGESKNIQLYTGLSMLGSKTGADLLKRKAQGIIQNDAKAISQDS